MITTKFHPHLQIYNEKNLQDEKTIEYLNDFLQLEEIKKLHLLFVSVSGSRSYNTTLENKSSDVDIVAVYTSNPLDFLGLPQCNQTKSVITEHSYSFDFTIYELNKFCDLLIKGNPVAMDIIFGKTIRLCDKNWNILMEKRNEFITKQVVKNYIGYARGQLETSVKRFDKSDSRHSKKAMYHAIRNLYEARRIVNGEEPLIFFEGKERDYLMKIRNGEISRTDATSFYYELLEEIKKMQNESTFKKMPDNLNEEKIAFLNEWVQNVRLKIIKYS